MNEINFNISEMRNTMCDCFRYMLGTPNLKELINCFSHDLKISLISHQNTENTKNNLIKFIQSLSIGYFGNIIVENLTKERFGQIEEKEGKYFIKEVEFTFKQKQKNELISTIKTTNFEDPTCLYIKPNGKYFLKAKIITHFILENEKLKIFTIRKFTR